ncbi:TRAP transporter substrate-binding protein DctP [Vermiculatibacterium agrestimuris]|uniref:TRAP transporter substrate-binding protein DctP n=1 Tax=Vermiculatibacterium agrestimuris TaxID=2941519 RepID=UPI00203FCE1C|nr:TRAP transporter substrate-binding protein DctP [Vermiculatibacterium agrestimuris]
MKKVMASLLSCAMLLSVLSGCGGQAGSDGKKGGDEKSVTLKIHCDYTEDHPTAQILAQFCEKVSEATDGTLTVKPYYAGSLGDYTTVFDEVSKGSIDMTFGCNSTTFGQALNIWNMPYLAATWEEASELFAPGSYVNDTMTKLCDDVGIKLLGLHLVGAGGLAGTKMPTDWDVWGANHSFVLRVPNSDTVSVPMAAMGYQVQAVNWSELFTSVQTGVVDGFVGGHPPVCYDQFRDVIKYYIQINNFFEVATVSINKEVFEGLSENQQKALEDAAAWVFEESLAKGEETENEYLEKMADYGIEVIKPDDAVLEEFGAKCREEVWPKLRDSMGNDEVFDGLIESLSK